MSESETREDDLCESAVERRCGVALDFGDRHIALLDRMSSVIVGSCEIGGAEGSSRYLMMASRPRSVMPFEAVDARFGGERVVRSIAMEAEEMAQASEFLREDQCDASK